MRLINLTVFLRLKTSEDLPSMQKQIVSNCLVFFRFPRLLYLLSVAALQTDLKSCTLIAATLHKIVRHLIFDFSYPVSTRYAFYVTQVSDVPAASRRVLSL